MVKLKLDINISNRSFILIGAFLIVIVLGGIVFAVDNPAVFGHSLDQVAMPACAVDEALVKNSTGWGCATASGGTLECVTGDYPEGGTGTIYSSSLGKTYSFSSVFSTRVDYFEGAGAPVLICKSPWILTGCSAAGSGDNGDEWMLNTNDCRADYSGWAKATARCCKIV